MDGIEIVKRKSDVLKSIVEKIVVERYRDIIVEENESSFIVEVVLVVAKTKVEPICIKVGVKFLKAQYVWFDNCGDIFNEFF